jgi:hypothetical protein
MAPRLPKGARGPLLRALQSPPKSGRTGDLSANVTRPMSMSFRHNPASVESNLETVPSLATCLKIQRDPLSIAGHDRL